MQLLLMLSWQQKCPCTPFGIKYQKLLKYFPGSSFSCNDKPDLCMSSFFCYLISTIYFRTEFRETNLWIQYDYIVFINNFL